MKRSSWNRKEVAAEQKLQRPLHSGWEATRPERQQSNNRKRKSRAIKSKPKWRKSATRASLQGNQFCLKHSLFFFFSMFCPTDCVLTPICIPLPPPIHRGEGGRSKIQMIYFCLLPYDVVWDKMAADRWSLMRMMTAVHPAPKSKQRYR